MNNTRHLLGGLVLAGFAPIAILAQAPQPATGATPSQPVVSQPPSAQPQGARPSTAGAPRGVMGPRPSSFELLTAIAPGSVDAADERQRLAVWIAKPGNRKMLRGNPLMVRLFNGLKPEQGGSKVGVRWLPRRFGPRGVDPQKFAWSLAQDPDVLAVPLYTADEMKAGPTKERSSLLEFLAVSSAPSPFTAADILPGSAKLMQSSAGPQIEFSLKPESAERMSEWSSKRINQRVAYASNGMAIMVPRMLARLTGPVAIAFGSGSLPKARLDEILESLVGSSEPPVATTVAGADENTPLPAGADPADLRAIQGQQAMLKAERRLRAMIKAGKIDGFDRILTFEELSSWPYEDGLKGMPPVIKKLDKKQVLMTGFMLPIDEVENIKEFLLVQSLWACCYGQPPDINGIVRVVMKGDARIDYQFDPIKVVGTFKVKAVHEDGYCVDIYQLEATSVEVLQ